MGTWRKVWLTGTLLVVSFLVGACPEATVPVGSCVDACPDVSRSDTPAEVAAADSGTGADAGAAEP